MSVLIEEPVESGKKFSDHKGQNLKAMMMVSLGFTQTDRLRNLLMNPPFDVMQAYIMYPRATAQTMREKH